jgi:hypothetical protein
VRHVRTPPSVLRSAAVLALAALCVHQLAYLLSFGAHTGPVLEGRGHEYLSILGPVLAAVAVFGIAATVVSAARRAREPKRAGDRSWLAWAALLLAVFTVQEAAESLVRTGSLAGLVSLAQTSGTAAVLAAVAVGRLVGLALSGLRALDATLAGVVPRRPRRPTADRAPGAHSPLHFPRLTLAFGFSRRPPPATPA